MLNKVGKANKKFHMTAANAPIYGVSDTYLGYGIVGGSLLSFSDLSQNASEIALQVLNGKSPSEIPAITSKNRNYFDWIEMKQWGINEKDLPTGSIIPVFRIHNLLIYKYRYFSKLSTIYPLYFFSIEQYS